MTPLETARLRLRPFREQDLPAFVAYRREPEVARYQSWSDYGPDDAAAFFAAQRALRWGAPDSWYQVAVAARDTDALLGDCAVHFLPDDQVELGFSLAPARQGQGVMREALGALLDALFGAGVHRAIAITDTRNAPCVRLLERLGFRREGHFVENVLFKGAWGDEYLYALLQREWASRPGALEVAGP